MRPVPIQREVINVRVIAVLLEMARNVTISMSVQPITVGVLIFVQTLWVDLPVAAQLGMH